MNGLFKRKVLKKSRSIKKKSYFCQQNKQKQVMKIKTETYIRRRAQLKKDMGSGLLLFLGNAEVGMNYADNTYRFRQDSTFLYFFVFIPFQMMSIYKWSRKKDDGGASFEPKFLDMPRFWLSIFIGLAVTAGDYFIQTLVFQHNGFADNIIVKLCNGLMISSSFLANYWLIYRKNDSWLYWFIYSVAGIVLFIYLGNIFSLVLFCFFLVINSMAGIAWIKNTKPEFYFWAAPFLGKKK